MAIDAGFQAHIAKPVEPFVNWHWSLRIWLKEVRELAERRADELAQRLRELELRQNP